MVAGRRCDGRCVRSLAESGWFERGKREEKQSIYARVCWAAELFAAGECLLHSDATSFQGVATYLSICAVDALGKGARHGKTSKALIVNALIRPGNTEKEARAWAGRLWNFRCQGAHAGMVDRIDIKCTVIVGDNFASGNSIDEVMREHRQRGSRGPVTLISQSPFSQYAQLYAVARHACAEAIAHTLSELMKG